MKFLPLLTLLILPAAFAADPRGDNPDATPSTPQEQLAKFHVPPGFEVQLVADESQIAKPMNLNFDGAGRLWVTGSEMYPWPARVDALGQPIAGFDEVWASTSGSFDPKKAPTPSDKASDIISVLSDFGPDGRARKVEVFADGLNIPIGVQPLPRKPGAKGDSVIVYSIPAIWRLEDTDGDGRADKREPLYTGFDFRDTHGMSSNYLYWIDGWIYGCHGFRNHSEVKDRAGHVTVFDSGNTYRFRPDGSKIETYTHGQTNPFGLTVDPLGNFFSADSHSKPVMLLQRGGYYEGIGKKDDGLGFAPVITKDDHGSSAIAGIAYYADDKFPAEYRGNLFNGNPVTQRINRDRLEWHGSTPKAIRMPDFLTCDDPWFRPIQVKLGPDGALWIADFYNPIIGHYEFPLADPRRDHAHGRIWRVVWRREKKNAPIAALPDLAKMDANALVQKLSDPNLVVRTLATNELVDRSGAAQGLSALNAAYRNDFSTGATHGEHALWAFERLGSRESVEDMIGRQDDAIAISALKILAARDVLTGEQMRRISRVGQFLQKPIARAGSEALSRHPAAENVGHILKGLELAPLDDVQLTYGLRIALRNTLLAADGFKLAMQIEEKFPEHAERIAEVSLAVPTPAAAEFLLQHLKRTDFAPARTSEYLRHAALYLLEEKISLLVELIQSHRHAPLPRKLNIAEALTEATQERDLEFPDDLMQWAHEVLLAALAEPDKAMVKRAVEALQESKQDDKLEPLAAIVRDETRDSALRLDALDATANLPSNRDLLAATLANPRQIPLRKRAAELLARGGHTAEVLAVLPTAPQELVLTISGTLAKTEDGCGSLLDAIEAGKVSARVLLHKTVASRLESRAAAIRDRANALTAGLPPEDTRLNTVIADRSADYGRAKPDTAHGAQLFQQNCAVCHRFRDAGGNVGPNLDGVVARGPARLIEDILDPNRNVDPLFRQTTIDTNEGETLVGANVREQDGSLLLTDASGHDLTVAKSRIKQQSQSALSLMPAIFETAISPTDFTDLLGYLLTPSRSAGRPSVSSL